MTCWTGLQPPSRRACSVEIGRQTPYPPGTKLVPFVPLVGGVIITLFGGLTLYFNNPIFIYMKPTIVNIIFAISDNKTTK